MPAAPWGCALLQVVGFVQLAAHTPDDELAYTSSLDRTVRRRTVLSHRAITRALTPRCRLWRVGSQHSAGPTKGLDSG